MEEQQIPVQMMPKGVSRLVKEQKEEKFEQEQKDIALIIDNFDDDFTLSSWGWTSDLKITKGRQKSAIQLKIKSVGVADVIEQTGKGQPRPPSVVKEMKRGSQEALALGSKHAVIVREIDEADPVYLQHIDEHNRRSGQLIMLAGLAYDIEVPKGSGNFVLKGANVNAPSDILDPDGALKWLRDRGITGSHYAQILKDIRGLTEDVEEQEVRE